MPVSRQSFVAGTAAAFATVGIVTPARAADFNLKYGLDLPAEHPINVRSVEAFARIKKATNGRVDIKSFPTSVLGSDPNMIAQIRSGAIDALAMPGAFLNQIAPLASIENLAYAYPNRETVFRAFDGDLGKVVRDDIQSRGGMVVLEKIWENGFREITTSTKPIRNVGDLAGLKIRVSPGEIRVDTFKSLGAAPSPISLSELYTSLQTHIIDGQENPLLLIYQQKFFEVQKYVSMSDHIWSGYWTLFNQDVWNKFGKGIQDIISREMATSTLAGAQRQRDPEPVRARQAHAPGHEVQRRRQEQLQAEAGRGEVLRAVEGGVRPEAWAALEKYANKLA